MMKCFKPSTRPNAPCHRVVCAVVALSTIDLISVVVDWGLPAGALALPRDYHLCHLCLKYPLINLKRMAVLREAATLLYMVA